MRLHLPVVFTLAAVTAAHLVIPTVSGAEPAYPKARVSFEDFKGLVAEVEAHRAARLIDPDTFLDISKKEGVVILDTRSKFRYDRIHLKGAVHLNFSDFTQANLAAVIPSFDTTVLIYCNNNFDGNPVDFASKVALPSSLPLSGGVLESLNGKTPPAPATPPARALDRQFKAQEKPLMMALNVPTYINLYGYGYRNVYELHELVKVTDPRIAFEGSMVK